MPILPAVNKWSRVLNYFRPELPGISLALVFLGLSIVANLLKPWPVALIIDYILGGKPAPDWLPAAFENLDIPTLLAIAAFLIFVLHSAQGLFSAGQNFLSIQAGLRGLARIRNELFTRMQKLSLAFYQRRNQGDLIYRATWDTYSLQTIFQHGLFKFLASFATVALMVVVMWQLNRSLTLITVGIFPPLLVTMYFFGRLMNKRSLAAHQADSKVTSLVQQNISAIALVQGYARERDEARSFAKQVNESFLKRRAQHGLEVIYWLAIAVLFGIATACLTWWGAREIFQQRLTVGELVIFLSYLGQLYDPLNQLSHVGATVSDANAGMQRIFELLDSRDEVPESDNPAPFPRMQSSGAAIELDRITFGYDPGKPILQQVSLRVAPGEVIGLVGPSGAGKTSLLNLLPRFYDPQQGTICIAEVNSRELSLTELREQIAYVFQESFLLPGSIAENIAYGCPNATAEQIEAAARDANAYEFIAALPEGFKTIVGEGGARLSVGEKQRINIARAFLKNAPILLLDEPTSAMDVETEASVVESLNRLISRRTTIMAAHRFSTLQCADRIVVLENGRITEAGAPLDLLQSGGYYSRVSAQWLEQRGRIA